MTKQTDQQLNELGARVLGWDLDNIIMVDSSNPFSPWNKIEHALMVAFKLKLYVDFEPNLVTFDIRVIVSKYNCEEKRKIYLKFLHCSDFPDCARKIMETIFEMEE